MIIGKFKKKAVLFAKICVAFVMLWIVFHKINLGAYES
jgi:hypothetical protein